MADFNKKSESKLGTQDRRGAPTKGGQKRDNVFPIKLSNHELDMYDELVIILNKRRNVDATRPGLLIYLLEREYEKQQNLKHFNPLIIRDADGKRQPIEK